MKKLIGILFLLTGGAGFIFFKNYRGDLIAHQTLWLILSFILIFIGLLILRFSGEKQMTEVASIARQQISSFKNNADKIPIGFDECSFHDGSYTGMVTDNELGMLKDMASVFAGSVQASMMDTQREVNITKSWLSFNTEVNGQPKTFTSGLFPFDSTTLKYHILKKDIELWVSRTDPEKYLFLMV